MEFLNNLKINRRLIIAYQTLPLLNQYSTTIHDRILSTLVSTISSLRENNVISQVVWVGCPSKFQEEEIKSLSNSTITSPPNELINNNNSNDAIEEFLNDQTIQNSFNNTPLKESFHSYQVEDEMDAELDQLVTVEDISTKLYDDACNKFTYQYLRPLFHYSISNVQFSESRWNAYIEFNQLFAKTIESIYQEGDIIWIHGLELLLLPKILRKLVARSYRAYEHSLQIGYFSHFPFPAVEVFRCMPSRKKILKGMLGANLVGFETYCYSRYFNQSCTRILGASISLDGVKYKNEKINHIQFTKVSVYASGIDPRDALKALAADQSKSRIQELRETFKGKKIIISKDHGDTLEATTRKLLAFELFLKKNPDWISKVVFILVCEPSLNKNLSASSTSLLHKRLSVGSLNSRSINETVARINGEYGKIGMNPIEYITRLIDYNEMCAMFHVSNVFISTPLREGMNLDVHDFVASHNIAGSDIPGTCSENLEEQGATLILSEFDGSCRCFGGAIQVNPYSIQQIAQAIHDSLILPRDHIFRAHKDNLNYILTNTCLVWGDGFLSDLCASSTHATPECLDDAHQLKIKDLERSIKRTKKRLFIFDYEGAFTNLLPMSPQPYLPNRIARILKTLTNDPNNITYVISSRDTETIESLLENIPSLGIGSEGGNFLRSSNGINLTTPAITVSPTTSNSNASSMSIASGLSSPNEWQNLSAGIDMSWKETVVQIVEHFTERLPLSTLEVNKATITWSYENCVSDYAMELAQELLTTLMEIAGKKPIGVTHNNKTIEIKPSGIGKSCAMKKIIDETQDLDFIFCIGDDRTEVELFQLLDRENPNHFPISVGSKKSYSKYFVPNQRKVLEMLESALNIESGSSLSIPSAKSIPSKYQLNPLRLALPINSNLYTDSPTITSFAFLSNQSTPNTQSNTGFSFIDQDAQTDDKPSLNRSTDTFPLPSIPFYSLSISENTHHI